MYLLILADFRIRQIVCALLLANHSEDFCTDLHPDKSGVRLSCHRQLEAIAIYFPLYKPTWVVS